MPSWDYVLDLSDFWKDQDLPWFKKRDIVVGRIKAEPWYDEEDLGELMEELSATDKVSYFDILFDEFYDYADYHRIWVKTF